MKVRVKFSKHGPVRYIGHLDIMRYFQKAIRRSGIPVAYTQGFNPHQRLAFAQPLGVGIESNGEYFDLELIELEAKEKMMKDLNDAMADGIQILDMVVLPEKSKNAMASVQAATYKVSFFEKYLPNFDWKDGMKEFLSKESIPYVKNTKKSTITLNLKESIYDYKILDDGLFLMVNASSGGNIKPKYILESYFASLEKELSPYALFVTRLETYGIKGENEEMNYVPLSDFGEDF